MASKLIKDSGYTILDGAMGTLLQREGLPLGARPEIFGMQNPDILTKIHKSYIAAGSDIIYADTFGANAHKLEGTGYSVREVINANIAAARQAAEGRARVALDIGPIGELMEPLGTLSFDDAYDIYREMVCCGQEAGADLVVFETMTDLYEVKAAVLAAKENTDLPVWVTMSFEKSGRTFTGTKVSSMAATLDGLGVDAMGINCSLGPAEILPLIEEMRQWTSLPLIAKPNAGLPDPATGRYDMTAESFAEEMEAFGRCGVRMIGGCCGTTPDFIRALAALEPPAGREKEATATRTGICSAARMVEIDGVRVIGERINPTGKKRFQQALREHDMNYIMGKAIEQADAGADILDVNVGLPGIDEAGLMKDVVKAVQSVTSLPLQIDSSNPQAIEAGLRACNGRAIVNSVNGEPEVMARVLPIVRKYGATVVGLTMDRSGIPQTAEGRFKIAERILGEARALGIPDRDVFIDCLTLTISAQQDQAVETLKAVRRVKEELGLHCVLGVSNISFGLPERKQVTTSFLTQALCCGLDLPIVNPNQKEIMDAIAAFKALSGEDPQCQKYIERFAGQATASTTPASAPAAGRDREAGGMTIEDAVLKGLGQEVRNITTKLLETMGELDLINGKLIPALDLVGEKYEKEEIFLPQLISSANAACAGFDLIKDRIAAAGADSVSKGKIIMATVEGDIHDIGKNIVRVVLENYGYQVIDLGKDVPPEKVVETAIAEEVRLVGLSALMTTTVDSMKRTIEALRRSGHQCQVFVGGAVLTEDYARQIGADFYTRDAKASADVARKVLG